MHILVAGGAGYIGSHMAKWLSQHGHSVVILDNLSTGHKSFARYGELVTGDLGDRAFLDQLFSNQTFDAVMHFAASSLVGESVSHPAKYYQNNLANTLTLLDVMRDWQCHNFIFSSTAAVFGEPDYSPIDEQHPLHPINPYGQSKLMVERVLQDYAQAYGLNSVCLRYFNAAGADPEGELGECHDPETHLIPLILQAANGKRDAITVFGRDYKTPDGTCVRDYIHVQDLCSAHMQALQKLYHGQLSGANAFNLGNGNGFSVAEVIAAAEKVVSADGKTLTILEGNRRPGDPAILVADSQYAREKLDWEPAYPALETIIQHAWEWEKKL